MALLLLTLCCSCSLLLPDAAAQTIVYPFTSTCAVEGSTLTLPCSFTPLTSAADGTATIYLGLVRVLWCRNHIICHRETPTVYDSKFSRATRYRYLGDMEGNCTLQIRNVHAATDAGTFRFRMEANQTQGHFTNRTGVRVEVPGLVQMEISRSDNHTEARGGGTVTLRCTSNCTTHQLKVTWFRDGHALPESGPALQLGPLTAEDSGNYTCELKTRTNTRSQPYSLRVEALEGGRLLLIAAVSGGVLLAGVTLILILVFIRRKRAAAEDSRAEEKTSDSVHQGAQQRDTSQEVEEVEDISYASVHFKPGRKARKAEQHQDAVTYSSVAGRG